MWFPIFAVTIMSLAHFGRGYLILSKCVAPLVRLVVGLFAVISSARFHLGWCLALVTAHSTPCLLVGVEKPRIISAGSLCARVARLFRTSHIASIPPLAAAPASII